MSVYDVSVVLVRYTYEPAPFFLYIIYPVAEVFCSQLKEMVVAVLFSIAAPVTAVGRDAQRKTLVNVLSSPVVVFTTEI